MRRDWMGHIQQKEDGSEILNYNDESFPVYLYQGWIEPGVTWAEVANTSLACGEQFWMILW